MRNGRYPTLDECINMAKNCKAPAESIHEYRDRMKRIVMTPNSGLEPEHAAMRTAVAHADKLAGRLCYQHNGGY